MGEATRERPEQEEPENLEPVHPKARARPRNWLEPIVLALLRERDPYGYELGERLRELGFEAINPGTLYRTLRRMEWHGLCESEWETSERGRVRRRYSISEAGEAHLGLWAEALE